MKILFIGGHELGSITLENLVRSDKDICGVVVTDTDNSWYSGVDEIAVKYDLRLFRESNINDDKFLKQARDLKPDLITVVNFEQILKKEIIDIPQQGCINVHASLLPKYRGRAPLNWAIINGERETGVTVHYIEEGIDTGDIILQEKIEIKPDDYIEDLLEKVKEIYPVIVDDAIQKIKNRDKSVVNQNLDLGFYCGKRTPEDGKIDWNKSSDAIYNLIRALSKPYPGARSYYKGQEIVIWKASLESINSNDKSILSGTILRFEDNEMVIKSNPNNILITEYKIDKEVDIVIGEILK